MTHIVILCVLGLVVGTISASIRSNVGSNLQRTRRTDSSNTNTYGVKTDKSIHRLTRRWGKGRESISCSFWKWSNAWQLGIGCRWVKNRDCWINNNGHDSKKKGYCNTKTCCAKPPPNYGPVKDVFTYTCPRFLDEVDKVCMGQLIPDSEAILATKNCSWGTTEFVRTGLPVCSYDFCCAWVTVPFYVSQEFNDINMEQNINPLVYSPNPVDELVQKAGSVPFLYADYLLSGPGNWRSLKKPKTYPPKTID